MPRPPYHRCLLLNAGYEPLRVVSWQKAMTLWLVDKVELLDVFPDVVRTPNRNFPAPAVVRLCNYVNKRPFQVPFSRRNVLMRDGFRCQYCGRRFESSRLTMDHVVPRSRGGRTTWENVTTCCLGCNHDKSNRTPEEAGMPLLAVPVRPRVATVVDRGLFLGGLPAEWQPWLEYLGLGALDEVPNMSPG